MEMGAISSMSILQMTQLKKKGFDIWIQSKEFVELGFEPRSSALQSEMCSVIYKIISFSFCDNTVKQRLDPQQD